MKTQYIVLSCLFVLASLFTVQAQKGAIITDKKETVKVWGECGMCKKKIENAATAGGAAAASWNEESKLLQVTYNIYTTNSTKIQQAIAAAGYDTKNVAATAEAYNNLPACCHYARKETVQQVAMNCCSKEKTAGAAMNCAKDMRCCKETAGSKDAACSKACAGSKDMLACKEMACCKS